MVDIVGGEDRGEARQQARSLEVLQGVMPPGRGCDRKRQSPVAKSIQQLDRAVPMHRGVGATLGQEPIIVAPEPASIETRKTARQKFHDRVLGQAGEARENVAGRRQRLPVKRFREGVGVELFTQEQRVVEVEYDALDQGPLD